MDVLLKNFRIIDKNLDTEGSIKIKDGIIDKIELGKNIRNEDKAAVIIDGSIFCKLPLLMPAFVDLHSHFRESGFLQKGQAMPSETIESASLAAAAGGFGTVVCMANTNPVTDTLEKAADIKRRSDNLGLIDLLPVLSLTKNMDGKSLSEITKLPSAIYNPLMLSEDGKDIADDELFVSALKEAKRFGLPVSCHCDFGGAEAEESKKSGAPRSVWSRIEENRAVERVLRLAHAAGGHVHIAHVSTKEAVKMIRAAKANRKDFVLTCEAAPHSFTLDDADAEKLGAESHGRVNPPLRFKGDRDAIIEALRDGTIDAIATDHAPHSLTDKENGSPGFSGLETAFSVVFTELVVKNGFSLLKLSELMSYTPACIAGFGKGQKTRGIITEGVKADLVIVDPDAVWNVSGAEFISRGKNTPFEGKSLYGKIIMTIHNGKIVYTASAK